MANNKVSEIVKNIATPITDEQELELVDVEFVREGKDWYLRVYIDKDGGVTLDDCEAVSRPLSEKLDEMDPIPQSYILEVSSPGVERPFRTSRDFEKAIGENVRVKFYKAMNGRKTIEGILEKYDGETVTILTDNDEREIYQLKDISKIHRIIMI
ncbi:MAG: ribosome maturation factor RimP [Clostridiaceae bacterium]|nr:ribosome maturation factor RimP [Clostridiaceae bacterium]